jgi:hypothetical protein
MFKGTYIPSSEGETAEFRDVSGKAANHGKTQQQTIFEFRLNPTCCYGWWTGVMGLPRHFTEMRRVAVSVFK